jgi:hypothetical protein
MLCLVHNNHPTAHFLDDAGSARWFGRSGKEQERGAAISASVMWIKNTGDYRTV